MLGWRRGLLGSLQHDERRLLGYRGSIRCRGGPVLCEGLGVTQYDCSLREALAERVDGQRRAVLVLGAGLHSQLLGMAGATDAEWAGAAAFCRWVRLLEQMARHVGAPLARHDSLTATWEGLILARKMASPGDEPAHKHEEALFKELVGHLSATRHPLLAPGAARAAAQERCRLFFGDYRDVVTLNMDLTISRLLGAEPLTANESRKVEAGNVLKYARNVWPRFETDKTRVWHLHGHVNGRAAREGIILGTRSYGMNIDPLESARKVSKQREKAWQAVAAPGEDGFGVHARWRQPDALQLMDLFLHEPMVFVGCSMGWEETDLWWALHQRARNLARIPPSQRPPVLLLMKDSEDNRRRLQSEPAGVRPIFYRDYADIWRAVGMDA